MQIYAEFSPEMGIIERAAALEASDCVWEGHRFEAVPLRIGNVTR
jgi:hypothetical protein